MPSATLWRRLRITVEVPRDRRPPDEPGAHDTLRVAGSVDDLPLEDRSGDIRQTVEEYRDFFRRAAQPATPAADLASEVAAVSWYHTIELPGGVVTDGVYDHRPLLGHYGLPGSLEGKRCLDAGTWDGFWAFEMERRGAEVVSLDVARMSEVDLPAQVRDAIRAAGVDPPTGAGFRLAHRALSSRVDRVVRSVYDVDPGSLGTFDLVHVGDLLLHLENPVAALRSLRSVAADRVIISDCYDPKLPVGQKLTSYRGGWRNVHWWMPALDTLGQMIVDAGFTDVRVHNTYRLPFRGGSGAPWWRAVFHARV